MLFVGGLAARVLISLALEGEVHFSALDVSGQIGAGALLLGLWAWLRRGTYPKQALRIADLLVMNLVTIALSLMSIGVTIGAHPETVLLLALLVTFSMRVAYVPSSPRQTALVQASAMVWFVLALLYIQRLHAAVDPDDGYTGLRSMLISGGMWWFFASTINVGASHVIFGLRARVREAEQLGQYTLEAKLGEGGMGMVYRAKHAFLRRPTAIKLLPPSRTDARSVERFQREVQRTAGLTHPNIVSVFDYGRTPDGVFYYAMEFLDGLDLDALVHRFGPQPPARVVHILAQICEGLAAAHEVELIHRDIKPANVFLLRGGRSADLVKIVDFGLVKDVGEEAAAGLTGDNVITGTPQYLSPEAIKTPESVDARSDLYAVGAVGYYLLTGEHVFVADTVVEIASMHLGARPEPPSERLGHAVPETLEELILWCLEKDPALRPPDAETLLGQLRGLEEIPLWRHEEAVRWWTEGAEETASRELPTQAGRHAMPIDLGAR